MVSERKVSRVRVKIQKEKVEKYASFIGRIELNTLQHVICLFLLTEISEWTN